MSTKDPKTHWQILGPRLYPEPPIWYHVVPAVILPMALLIPRTVLTRWQHITIIIPLMTALTAQAWREMGGVDVITVDVLLWAFFLFVFRDPWKDFRHIPGPPPRGGSNATTTAAGLPSVKTNGDITEQTADLVVNGPDQETKAHHHDQKDGEPYPATLWKRLPWAGRLLVSIRLENWLMNVPSHDRLQPPAPGLHNRKDFARYAVLCFVRGYLTLDLTSAYIQADTYFHDPHMSLDRPLPLPQLALLPPRLVRTMAIGAQAWALIGQMFYLACLLPIGLNNLGLLPDEWSPHMWSRYFGHPRVIFLHGVRGFWGQYWHQTMRWTVCGPGYAIADALGLGSGSLTRYAIISVVTFMLSGLVHTGLVPPEPLNAIVHLNRLRFYVWSFFSLQPVAMLAETLVAKLVARHSDLITWRSGFKLKVRMLVNGLWTVAWFALTLGLLGDMARQLDYWHYWTVPISIWKGLRGEGWTTWPIFR